MFEEPFEMIIGSNIAKKYNLKVGDDIVAAHGVSESSNSHEKSPYKVTGILEKTYTVYDDVLFTSPQSVWNVHEHHDEDDVEMFSGEHTEHDENEENEEHSEHYGEYTALLIKTRNPSAALTLIDDVNKLPGVLAVNPSTVLRSLIESIDTTTVIVYVLCAIIAVMSFIKEPNNNWNLARFASDNKHICCVMYNCWSFHSLLQFFFSIKVSRSS